MFKLTHYFWNLVEQLPSLLVMLGCLVFAFVRWKRYPKVSLMVVLGLCLLLLHVIVFLFVYDLVPPIFIKPENYLTNATIRRNVYLVLGLISNTVAAISFGVLLVAIFMQRTRAPHLALG
jgi:hypothetical protein